MAGAGQFPVCSSFLLWIDRQEPLCDIACKLARQSFIPVGLQFLVALKQVRLPKIMQHFNFRLLETGSSASFLHPGSAMPSQPTLPAIQLWAGKISCLLFICERFVSQFKLHISFQYLFLFFCWHPDNKGPLGLNKFSNLYTCAQLHTHTQACTCIKYCIFSIDTLCVLIVIYSRIYEFQQPGNDMHFLCEKVVSICCI